MQKADIVKELVGTTFKAKKDKGIAFAPTNIALCKYWGKRDHVLNLPETSSVSISMAYMGSNTEISFCEEHDTVLLNGVELQKDSIFVQRLVAYLDMFRPSPDTFFHVNANNSIPTAAGLASSASGFAATVLALKDLYEWDIPQTDLSILCRIGSGSATRSIYSGFVHWHRGTRDDGMDSYAEQLPTIWPDFRIAMVIVSREMKPISSTDAMNRTKETSTLYKSWNEKVATDIETIHEAITDMDLTRLGEAAESNALSMHATMMGAWPPVFYWRCETIESMQKVWQLRQRGVEVYFTIDAGPNIKLIYDVKDEELIQKEFDNLRVIAPFSEFEQCEFSV